MRRLWSTRETQIEKVLNSTTNIYGSIKGIAGKAIQNIEQLELGGTNLIEEKNS